MAPAFVTVLISYQSQPGRETAARAALSDIVAKVLASEPDCLGIEILEQVDVPGRFLLHERWTSQEAYTGPHLQTPHLRAFIAAAPATFAGPPDITYWQAGNREH